MKLGTSNCVNHSIWNPKHSARYVYHTGTSASSIALHVRALLAKRNRGEQEICPVHHGSPLDSQLLHKERAWVRVLHREFAQEEMQEEALLGYPRPFHPRREVPQEHV